MAQFFVGRHWHQYATHNRIGLWQDVQTLVCEIERKEEARRKGGREEERKRGKRERRKAEKKI